MRCLRLCISMYLTNHARFVTFVPSQAMKLSFPPDLCTYDRIRFSEDVQMCVWEACVMTGRADIDTEIVEA